MYKDKCFPYIQPILPTVYSEALSYEESIGKLIKAMNKAIEQMNNITTDAVEQSKVYTDNKVAEAISDVTDAVNEVNAVKAQLDRQYNEFVALTNAQLNVFRNEISNIDERVTIGLIGANEYTNFAIKQNNDYLLEEVSKGLKDVRVVNYFTGESISVQGMFDYLAQFHLENAITYTQLANREKTFDQLVALDITYTQLALNGATLITL